MKLKEKIRFNLLSNRFVGKFFIKLNLNKLLHYSFRYEGYIGDVINKCLDKYLSEKDRENSKLRLALTVDIVYCYYRYRAHPNEYFLFGFRNLKHARRAQFLTQRYKDYVMINRVGLGDKRMFLEDKWRFYNYFKSYFKRDVVRVACEEDFEAFMNFTQTHREFIVKPMKGQCGKGIHIIYISESDSVETIFKNLLSSGEYIIEELIKQSPEVAVWNDSSVNTLRLPAFYNKTGFHILKPFLRMGRTGSIVDNAATGGVFSVVDEKSGILTTDGYNEYGSMFITHPDSNKIIKGWQIPEWNELLKIAEEIHSMVPDQPYIGWDFAYSVKGWVLVEGNWGQFMSEFADKEGIKNKFDNLFD